jgi:hypothetical protein
LFCSRGSSGNGSPAGRLVPYYLTLFISFISDARSQRGICKSIWWWWQYFSG